MGGFERFFADIDPPEYLALGGRLLLNELNCVACHTPPDSMREEFTGAPGPELRGIANRIQDPSVLQLLLRNPRFLKRGTTMPSLFAAADRDEAEMEALFHYLMSLKAPLPEAQTQGDAARGQQLYHTAGCVGCHAPGKEYFPPGWPEETSMDMPGIASAPIALATFWPESFLTSFLMDPAHSHPAERMPDFALSEQEAADIAVYLRINETTDPPGLPAFDLALARQGAALFSSKGCAACHDTGEGLEPMKASPLLLLEALPVGCLSEKPEPGGLPHYFLSPLQRKALQLGIASLAESTEPLRSPLEMTLLRQDCYACHTREDHGGLEDARLPYFATLPPNLDGLSSRRNEEELFQILSRDSLPERNLELKVCPVVLPPETAERIIGQFLE